MLNESIEDNIDHEVDENMIKILDVINHRMVEVNILFFIEIYQNVEKEGI